MLDNTKTNCAAMNELQRKHPKWIMRGCIAHGLALAMKDFVKYTSSSGRGASERTWGLRWAERVLDVAFKIANFLQDSSDARRLVCSFSFCLSLLQTLRIRALLAALKAAWRHALHAHVQICTICCAFGVRATLPQTLQ